MAIDVSFRDGYSTSAQDLSRFNKNFLINEGVANDGLKVSQSAVPAMSVQVSVGTAYFYGTGTTADTMFEFYSDSTETVTIPTASAQARIDIVCCKVDASTGVASLVVVSGTPSGSPAVPATPASHYKLANVTVGAGVTTITNANITDTRRSVFVAPTGARNQGLINGKIVPSVASNNLTVAIKTLQDTDPTPTNPVFVWIGGVLRPITSALSLTRNGGTSSLNMGSAELATREVDLFPYLQWNTTTQTLNLLASRIPYARKMSGFVNSATDEKGALGIINYNSNDDVVLVDRFSATSNSSNNFTATGNVYGEPIYETRWLTYQPTYTGSASMTWTSVTTTRAIYKISMHQDVKLQISALGTTGGTASTELRVTLPIYPTTFNEQRVGGTVVDNAGLSGQCLFNSTDMRCSRYDNANYGLGANRGIYTKTEYRLD